MLVDAKAICRLVSLKPFPKPIIILQKNHKGHEIGGSMRI